MKSDIYEIDGQSLNTQKLNRIVEEGKKIDLSRQAWDRVKKSRKIIQQMMADKGRIVYGINTGFGNFADKIISEEQRAQLQINLVRSHAVGVGSPVPLSTVKRMTILRINTLSKGRSGISPENLQKYIQAYNSNYLPMIPQMGTVGASGDLAPLSHLALGMMGQGKAWNDQLSQYDEASHVMKMKGLTPVKLTQKQGLALINGTQFMSSIISQVEVQARILLESSIIVYAFALEIFGFQRQTFDEQVISFYQQSNKTLAKMMRKVKYYLNEDISQLHAHRMENAHKNNTASSIVQAMQTFAAVENNLNFCERVVSQQLNSATDNPLVFGKQDGFSEDKLISAGNFHGQYVAKASDYVSMCLFALGRLSQPRIQRYLNDRTSNLPGFLVKVGGLNSGFMIAQYTSAALLSECKVLVKPASTDSIITSASQEDHVSMGGYAARKSKQVLEKIAFIIGIQLMHCLQAVDLIEKKPSQKLASIHKKVRKYISFMEEDKYFGPQMTIAKDLVMKGLHLL